MIEIQNYINGKLQPPVNGKHIDNVEPATGKVYSQIPNSDEQDINQAVEAAQKAYVKWSATSNEKRYEVLNKIADLIDRDLDKLAQAESIDNGKPLSLAKRVDIPRASSNFRFFATAILHFSSNRMK